MAGSNPSPLDLRLFHRLERDFYHKLVTHLTLDPELVKWVLSLWLWFESIGHHDFIRHVSSYPDHIVGRFVDEGNACLDRLVGQPTTQADELPFTSSLVKEPMDLHFFDYHRNVAIRGVSHFFENVADIIFDDSVMEDAAKDVDHPASRRVMSSGLIIRPQLGDGSSSSRSVSSSTFNTWLGGFGGLFAAPAVLPVVSSSSTMVFNYGRPWAPTSTVDQSTPQDQRSMFITFSRGYPLTREEITEFFNTRYGECVELVMIERAVRGAPPMYGRVVFTSALMIAVVLNSQRTAKFIIKGKHLWARIYIPRAAMNGSNELINFNL